MEFKESSLLVEWVFEGEMDLEIGEMSGVFCNFCSISDDFWEESEKIMFDFLIEILFSCSEFF